jgi:hypothetical protein
LKSNRHMELHLSSRLRITLLASSPASNLASKKLTECFNAEASDGKDHLFDVPGFDRCGKNNQDGFLKGCKDVFQLSNTEIIIPTNIWKI